MTKPKVAASEVSRIQPFLSDLILARIERYRVWIIVAILGLYIAGFNTNWRLEPDSALYLNLGRNLVEGKGYTFHGRDHRLAYPGVPVTFAAVYRVFGVESNLLPHLVLMALMGLATLGLTYRLFLLFAGRPTALLMTLGLAISRVFYRYNFELLTDLPFLFGVMAFFVGYEAIFHRRREDKTADAPPPRKARWYDFVLLIGGLGYAVAARPAMLALVAAAGLAVLWSLVRGRGRWSQIAVAALIIAAVAIFYFKDPRQQKQDAANSSTITYAEEDQLFHLHSQRVAGMLDTARKNIPGVFEGAVAKAGFGGQIAPGVNTVLALTIIIAGILLVRVRPLWGMWVLATLVMVALVPKPVERYFLPVLPILIFAWWTFTRWVERRVPPKWSRWAFLGVFALGCVPNAMGTAGFIIEQRQYPFLTHYKKGRYASVYEVANEIQKRTPKSDDPRDKECTWIATPDKFARILTLLSRRYCLEPEQYCPVDPVHLPNVFVLEPADSGGLEGKHRLEAETAWLHTWEGAIDPRLVGPPIPNADPDDSRPFTLHHTRYYRLLPGEALPAPVMPPVSPPATNLTTATNPAFTTAPATRSGMP